MKVGFTGTQHGMTDAQAGMVHLNMQCIFIENGPDEFHHGDCIEADAMAHDIADALGYKTISHPPINRSKRAFKKAAIELPPKDYLDRNKDIVSATDILIAAPKEMTEQLRSGTWSTVRFARKMKRQVILILPDGTVQQC
jgi:hypothetical protein